jgi:ATP-dependent Lon protease
MSASDSPGGGRSVLVAGQEQVNLPPVLPVLPVRDVVVFPGVTVPLAIGRPRSLAALEHAGAGGFLIVAPQRDPATEEPSLADLHPVACVVRIVRVIDARRDGKQAIVVGVVRTRLPSAAEPSSDAALLVQVDPIPDLEQESPERRAAWRRVVALSEQLIDLHDDYPDEWKAFVAGIPTPGLLADVIGSTLPLPPEEKLALLAEPDPVRRLERIARHLEREVTIAETQRALSSASGEEQMDPARRERLLRRRLRDIEDELGEGDPGIREVEELREKIEAANLPEVARAQADRELQRLERLLAARVDFARPMQGSRNRERVPGAIREVVDPYHAHPVLRRDPREGRGHADGQPVALQDEQTALGEIGVGFRELRHGDAQLARQSLCLGRTPLACGRAIDRKLDLQDEVQEELLLTPA